VQCSKELGVHGDSLLYTLDDWQVWLRPYGMHEGG
jgi:hypothetical protein